MQSLKLPHLLILAALFIFGHYNSAAQSSWKKLTGFNSSNALIWTSTGKNGVNYAITADNWIYYSTDHAETWQPFINNVAGNTIGTIKASKISDRVFCITSFNGLAYTDDHGQNWSNHKFTNGGGTSGFGAMMLAFSIKGNEILVSTAGSFTGAVSNPLYISYNNGNSFSSLSPTGFYPIDFHYLRDSLIFTNTNDGVYFTTSYNTGWTNTGFGGKQVTDMAITNDDLYIAVKNSSGDKVYKSTDYGQNWTHLSGLAPNAEIPDIEFDTVSNQLYAVTSAGVYSYKNSAWTQVSSEKHAYELMLTADQSIVYSGMMVDGAYKASVSSNTFKHVSKGLGLSASFLKITEDNQLYYGSVLAPFLSRLDLDSLKWSSYTLFDHLSLGTRLTAIQLDTAGNCIVGGGHYIARVSNRGRNINIIADSNTAPRAPIYNQLFPQKMFTGNDGSLSMIQHSIQNYVDYSPDMGNSWSRLYDSGVNGAPSLFSIEKVCSGISAHYVFGSQGSPQILVSTNGGNSWSTLPPPAPSSITRKIAIDKYDTLYAATGSELYRLNPTSQTWDKLNINLGNNSNKEVEITFDHNNRLYVLIRTTLSPFAEEGVYFSDDYGRSFTKIPFPAGGSGIAPLKFLGFTSDNIPMAVRNRNDMGGTNANAGIYYYSDSTFSGIGIPEGEYKKGLSLYPNPATDKVYLTAYKNLFTSALLISASGALHPVEIEKGSFSVSGFPRGVYVLKISIQNKSYMSRIMVL